jgi:hypothetical protein
MNDRKICRQTDRRLAAYFGERKKGKNASKSIAATRSERTPSRIADHENVTCKKRRVKEIKPANHRHSLSSISDPATPNDQASAGAQKRRSSSPACEIRQDRGQKQRQQEQSNEESRLLPQTALCPRLARSRPADWRLRLWLRNDQVVSPVQEFGLGFPDRFAFRHESFVS